MKKNILRLLRNFILLAIPLILLCVITFLTPMRYMAVEYTMWQQENDYVRSADSSAGTLILGDSRAKSSLIPAELGSDVYNIAIGGATSIEMYYALSNYLSHHSAPSNAIIIFAPYHFCSIDNWQQTLYYNYLSLDELAEVERTAYAHPDKSVHYPGWQADILSFKLRLPNKYLDAIYQAGISGRYAENIEKYKAVQNDLGYTEFGTEDGNDGLNYETHHDYFDYSPLVINYYNQLLDLCEKNGINVTIAQAPFNKASSEVVAERFLDEYKEFLEGIKEKHPQFTVETEVPVYDNEYFGDNNHMNRKGAEKFTKEFSARYTL